MANRCSPPTGDAIKGLPNMPSGFTADDDLAWEADQAQRHECVRGEVFATAADTLHLSSVQFSLPVAQAFDDLEGDAPPAPAAA
jgi:hypothetical protein